MTATAQAGQAPQPLLALREDIGIFPGPCAPDGSPTWTLHDPARNRFYRLGWQEFEILSRWNGGTKEAVVSSVGAETTLRVVAEDIDDMARFLFSFDLLRASSSDATSHFVAKAKRQRQSIGHWLLHNYLFMRIPLLRPDAVLTATQGYVGWAFTRGFAITIAILALLGLYGVARQWDVFRATFVDLFSVQGAVWFGVTLAGLKVIHELGHAYTAKRLGCRVPTMGVALLVMIPVLYTDVNESWKLTRRRDRLAIGIAGVVAELCCAAIALFAWSLLSDGPARSAAFLIATSTWLTTVLINASPFMRYDGYYVLSDWLETPNLHTRAFALARWWIRETLLGLGDPAPEDMTAGRRNFLIAFAVLTWIYRFTLFFGIAAIVYHFAVKILGVGMAAVEVGYFVVWPVIGEFREWWRRRGDIRWSRRTAASASVALAIIALLLLPWRSTIEAPALLKSRQHIEVFVPDVGARVSNVAVSADQAVEKGQRLLQLDSPDLDYKLAQVRSDLQILEWQMAARSVDAAQLTRSLVTEREYETALAELRGLTDQQDKLRVGAPISGKVVDMAPALEKGEWLAPKFRLMSIIDPNQAMAEAYVEEVDLDRIAIGDLGTFVAAADSSIEVPMKVLEIARTSTRVLSDVSLASVHGGPIDVRQQKQNELVPDRTLYRVKLMPQSPGGPVRLLRGHVVLRGEPVSLVKRLWRGLLETVIRESSA
jgi:putative peptide zinc metalloprotease protein